MERFSYARSLSPMIWTLVAISIVELCVVHLLVALLVSRWLALALTLVTVAGIVWLVRLIRSFRTLPVEVGEGRVTMRAGALRQIVIEPGNIAGLRESFTGEAVKARSTLNLGLLAYPNIFIDLREPVALRRRRIDAVAHRLDDPAAFVAALRRLTAAA